ncbi:MAG: hypothetical protein C0399_00710 [Syntrophus sp. (in: bacteria)]|nr:hypothetical protein [Syntrophus sp. (in: bacteria)]
MLEKNKHLHVHNLKWLFIWEMWMRKDIKRLSSFLVLLFVCICIYPFSSYAESQKIFFWRVQTKNSTVYLLGSIHLLKRDVYPLSRIIENSYDKSDFLAVEADIADIGNIDMTQVLNNAIYQGDDSIEKHISRDALAVVQKEAGRLGLPFELIKIQKPWLLALTMQSLELMKAGYDPEYGIDKYFLNKAQGKKKIFELESFDYQINLLSGFSDTEQELFLLYALKDLDVLTREVDKLIGAWKTGNVRVMETLATKSIVDESRFYPIYEKLIIARNRNMVSRIENYLQSRGTYFVVVGAAHLVGKNGIIQLLKNKGYSVEQL